MKSNSYLLRKLDIFKEKSMELIAIESDEQCDQIWQKNQSLAVCMTVDLVLGKI